MEIKEGMTGKAVLTVDTPHTARVMKSGSLDVLATPILSALMEEAACAAIAEALDEGMTTVGGSISLVHKAPHPSRRHRHSNSCGDWREGKEDHIHHPRRRLCW